jgi:hypothetical protein
MWYEHLLHLLHLSESPSTVMKTRQARKSAAAEAQVADDI